MKSCKNQQKTATLEDKILAVRGGCQKCRYHPLFDLENDEWARAPRHQYIKFKMGLFCLNKLIIKIIGIGETARPSEQIDTDPLFPVISDLMQTHFGGRFDYHVESSGVW